VKLHHLIQVLPVGSSIEAGGDIGGEVGVYPGVEHHPIQRSGQCMREGRQLGSGLEALAGGADGDGVPGVKHRRKQPRSSQSSELNQSQASRHLAYFLSPHERLDTVTDKERKVAARACKKGGLSLWTLVEAAISCEAVVCKCGKGGWKASKRSSLRVATAKVLADTITCNAAIRLRLGSQ